MRPNLLQGKEYGNLFDAEFCMHNCDGTICSHGLWWPGGAGLTYNKTANVWLYAILQYFCLKFMVSDFNCSDPVLLGDTI